MASRRPADTPRQRAVREDLAARTREILERPATPADPEAAAREKDVVAQCRYLLRLLSTRARSAGEMRERLTAREVPADVQHEVMARLQRAGLVDDLAFVRAWVTQRRELRGLADDALRQELSARGVASDLIDEALAPAGGGPAAVQEEARCRELAQQRLRRQGITPASAAAGDCIERARVSRRLADYLRRRGYPADLVQHVVAGEMLSATGQ
ncbi:regulatory protein RecX [Brachybacterium sillae]|uniref:regulatory protein RecX n=1 Tax=Brachybacterium sillae TaxID=2810536 RepID=UPI00217DB2A3|nr:regulatory protein RecX [Brachybacterium sillae]